MNNVDDEYRLELTPALRRYVSDPPPDSAVGRAKAFGYDVVALAIKMATTTPTERLRALGERVTAAQILRRTRT